MARGFTLIEILLSIALIAILTAIMTPVFYGFVSRNDLDTGVQRVAGSLRRAYFLAETNASDSSWGVFFAAGSVTLFKGSSFLARDQDFDEPSTISPTISISGTQEIVFQNPSGFPTAATTTTLSLAGESKTISINKKGVTTY